MFHASPYIKNYLGSSLKCRVQGLVLDLRWRVWSGFCESYSLLHQGLWVTPAETPLTNRELSAHLHETLFRERVFIHLLTKIFYPHLRTCL